MNRFFSRTAASALAISLASTPALAAGTLAGTNIQNAASVDYKVNAIAQRALTASETVKVDRVISATATLLNPNFPTVYPGQKGAALAFRITNTSNAPVSIAPGHVQLIASTFYPSYTKTFLDDGDGIFDPAKDKIATVDSTDLPVTPPDGSVVAFLVINVPTYAANDERSVYRALFYIREPNLSGSAVTQYIIPYNGPNTADVDTVVVDNMVEVSPVGFRAASPTITTTRTNRVVWDPTNGATNPKAIPGALIEYCLALQNEAGSADAADVVATDTLGSSLTYDADYGVYQNGTIAGDGTCNADGVKAGTFANGTVSGAIGTLPAGETRTVRYRATIN